MIYAYDFGERINLNTSPARHVDLKRISVLTPVGKVLIDVLKKSDLLF